MNLKIFLFLPIILVSCALTLKNKETKIGYNLSQPDLLLILPDTLREVSGLAIIDSSTFVCIQDENGILFIYDFENNEIKNQFTFHLDGDYEGITKVGNSIFVLRSDGMLFEIADFRDPDTRISSYQTQIPANNNEGLCYDKPNHRLLIACKGKIGKGPEFKDKRVIYGFNLVNKTLTNEPVYDFDLQDIKDFAIKNKLDIPSKTIKKKGQEVIEPFIKFRTSAICIHPTTKQLYLLSASDYFLFVFDADGTLLNMEQLNPAIFNKAEGISFFDNGDMLITNEGQDHHPTVLRFNYTLRKKD